MPNNTELDIRYFVNEEKKIVACTIYTDPAECAEEFYNVLNKCEHLADVAFMEDYIPKLCIGTHYSGKAVCHPDDTFDVEKGKELARARALMKYNNAKRKVFIEVFNSIDDLQARLSETINFYTCRGIECESDAYLLADDYEEEDNGN